MKVLKIKLHGSLEPLEVCERELTEEEDFKVLVRLKTMQEVLMGDDCFFDKYGNLCNGIDHLAPTYFGYLGKTFHVNKGCGFDVDGAWLKA